MTQLRRGSHESPYQRIASDLRRKITSGALRAGDRLPSTRDVAREYGVAMATATRALDMLCREGLAYATARVGIVVAGATRRSSYRTADEPDQELSPERIVRAAIEIADAEGLTAVSIRAIAAKLRVSAMSLYRHVPGKDALMIRMTDAVLSEESLPSTPPPGWRPQLEIAARLEWRAFRRHPWLAQVMKITRPQPLPNALSLAEWVLRALDGRDLEAAEMMNIHIALHGYVQGLAGNIEAEAQAASESGMSDDDWMRGQASAFEALAGSGQFPVFASVYKRLREGFELDFDRIFEVGLHSMLDGLAPMLERGRRAKKPKKKKHGAKGR